MTAVSVVTPFYNTEDYLAECIESVLAQTFRDFEYVLLDNCSTDASRAIAERYARRDPRIRLLRNDRLLPQVPNYNRALTLISGETRYCRLVQADDAIPPRSLEEMVAFADAHPSVALVGSYFVHQERVEPTGMPWKPTVFPGREACRKQLLDGVFLFGSPTVLLMRADVVRSRVPFYDEGRLFEDTEVCFEILREHDFGFVPEVLSFLRYDPRSIMGSWQEFRPAMLDRLIRLRRFGPEYLTEAEYSLHAGWHSKEYWRMLALAWLQRREPAFWEYHDRGLATIGERIRKAQLLRFAVDALVRRALPPGGAGRALLRSIRPGTPGEPSERR
jgi:glycosyltransferase involved in cell wall biosynthesis